MCQAFLPWMSVGKDRGLYFLGAGPPPACQPSYPVADPRAQVRRVGAALQRVDAGPTVPLLPRASGEGCWWGVRVDPPSASLLSPRVFLTPLSPPSLVSLPELIPGLDCCFPSQEPPHLLPVLHTES